MKLETLIARLKKMQKEGNPKASVYLNIDGNLEEITLIDEVELPYKGKPMKIILLSSE